MTSHGTPASRPCLLNRTYSTICDICPTLLAYGTYLLLDSVNGYSLNPNTNLRILTDSNGIMVIVNGYRCQHPV